MKKILTITLLSLISFSSLADFTSYNWKDDMTDTQSIEKYKSGSIYSSNKFGFRCDISPNKKDFMLTFEGKDSIATPNSSVQIKVRIDKGKVYDLEGRLYSNSYKSGLIRNYPDEFLNEIKTGEEMLVNIYSYNELELRESFSLKGSLKAVDETTGPCEVLTKYSDSVLNKIKKLEIERDKKISEIKTEYKKKISAAKASI